jgi:hypothetical protein
MFKMKTMKLVLLMSVVTLLVFNAGCSKNDDDNGEPDAYPKEVNITYRMSALSGAVGEVTSGSYVNITGGSTAFSDAALPYIRTFKRTVNKLDDIGISFIHNNSANNNTPFIIKLEILVNNSVVKTESFSGSSGVIGSIVYLFP